MKFPLLILLLATAATAQFIPDTFNPPKTYTAPTYKLVPLGPDVAALDFKAYMGSIDHLHTVMGPSWPKPTLTMEDQAKDMAGEKKSWDERKGFSFAVLTPDGSKELGCFYLRQSPKAGYDAVATLWAIQEEFDKGFEARLYKDMKVWVAQAWPFQKVAWPGIEIPQDQWKALPRKPRPQP
jgi:hypothetical protein